MAEDSAVIYRTGDGFVISSNGVWIPGSYEDERTARYAFQFSDEVLAALQARKNAENGGQGGTITFADLQGARR